MAETLDLVNIGDFYSSDYLKETGLFNSRSFDLIYDLRLRDDLTTANKNVTSRAPRVPDTSTVYEVVPRAYVKASETGEALQKLSLSETAFNSLPVSTYEPLASWSFTYNINAGLVNTTLNNTGSVNDVSGQAVLSTGTATDGKAQIQSVKSSRYIPGVGGVARFTAVFGEPAENSIQLIGIGNGVNGWFFGYDGLQFGILRRRDGVDNWIYQNKWSDDLKPNLNPQLGNVYEIRYQWLGFGMQYFSIENELGYLRPVHRISYSNLKTETSIYNPNLPITALVENLGNNTDIQLSTPSASSGLEGDGFNDSNSVLQAEDSTRTIVAGEDTPVIAFRLSRTYLSQENWLFAQALRLTIGNDLNKPAIYKVYIGGTVNDGTWAYLNESLSPLEVNTDLTSYTQGEKIGSFASGKVDSQNIDLETSKVRLFAGQVGVLTVSTTGSGDITAGVNWRAFV